MSLREDRPDGLVVHPARPGPVAELAPQGEHRLAAALAAHRPPQGLGLPGGEARRAPSPPRAPAPGRPPRRASRAGSRPAAGGRRGARSRVGAARAPVLHVGVHRPAADRPGADQGHLDREVVEVLGPGLQQALHLGAALDLEHAHRVGVLDLGVDRRVGEPDARQVDALAALAGDEVDALLDGREHPQAEQVDLHEAGVGAGVLVPLTDLPARERGGHHGHQLHQRAGADDHAAGVL